VIDLHRIVGFDWDVGNARKNLDKHDVVAGEAEEVFFHQPLLVLHDRSHSLGEQRLWALGRTALGRRLHLTFTLRNDGTLIRVISARDMSRKERMIYDQTPI
jgi:uncharacterized protein